MPNKILQEKSTARGRGRPKLDLAVRARNWVWYWMIKNELGLSDDELDARFVHINVDVRPRLFFRIRAMGSSPDSMRGYRSRKSLYRIVHEREPVRCAAGKKVFESELWDLLVQPQRALEEYSKVVQAILARRGWYRASDVDEDVGKWLLGANEPAFERGIGKAHEAMLRHLAACQPDIEALALLAALFREAYAAVELDLAIVLRRTLEIASRRFGIMAELPRELQRLLETLISDRIFYNRIYHEEAWQRLVVVTAKGRRGGATRAARIQDFAWKYPGIGAFQASNEYRFPVVPRTERLEWLIANRATAETGLLEILEKVAKAEELGEAASEIVDKMRRKWLAKHRPIPKPDGVSGLLQGPDDWRLGVDLTSP